MIKRIQSQIYKNYYVLLRNFFRLFDVTVWPLMLLFSITLFVNFVQADSKVVAMVILGVTGWRAVYHMQIDITTSYMEEYWSHSLNHFIISPIKIFEFVIGNAITGFLKFLFVLTVYLIIGYYVWGFYLVNIPMFIFGIFVLCVFGIALGLISLGIIIIYHDNAYTAAYIFPDMLVLLSGVYYPITIFPQTLQNIVKFIPAVHGFNVLKSTIGLATIDYFMLITTSIVWLVFASFFLSFCYNYAKRKGKLGRMS